MASMRLFTRLLLVQLATALTIGLLLFGVFYVERSATVSRLLAQRWAPVIQAALAGPGSAPLAAPGPVQPGPAAAPSLPDPPPAVQRREQAPAEAFAIAGRAPRYVALREALRAHGLPLRQLALARDGTRPMVWLAFDRTAGAPPLWLGFSDPLIEAVLPGRFLLALASCALILVGLAWWSARRLAQPLDVLRQRLQQHRPGDGLSADEPPIAGASPEVLAIEAAWREMRDRLARHEQERALMLAGISHDLRSPLARIRLAAELLPADDPALAPRRDSLVRNVQVADRLIEGFLDHARARQLPLDQPVDLAALAREALATRPGVVLSLPADGAALVLPAAHPLLLERALANLLDNAAEHGRPPLALRLSAGDGAVLLEVQDGGDGIAPGWRNTALQAFARGDASRVRPGTGLGLAIVQQTVQRLGGRIEFAGGPGAHVVRLVLPLAGAR